MSTTNKHAEIVRKIKSGNVNDALIKALVSTKVVSFTRIERNLYLRITDQGSGFWIYQYKIHKKPKRMTLGKYGKRPDRMPLLNARVALAVARAKVNEGNDPLAERKRTKSTKFKTVDDLAVDWLSEIEERLEHPNIPKRIYNQEIKPLLGDISIASVTGLDIRGVLKFVRDRKKTERPSIQNDTLMYLKQLFDHGVTLGVIHTNPAMAFKAKHAGGTEGSRDRVLSMDELKITFEVMRKYGAHFSRENYLSIAIIIVLGVRKGELIGLPWSELDLEKKIWYLPSHRAKNHRAIDIPLPHQVIDWLKELKVRAGPSDFAFPARRFSKRRAFISDDTLNHALTNLFGKKSGKISSSTGDVLGNAGIEYFIIHDLRRTTRTLMSKSGVRSEVAEKCINHVKKGVEGIYNRDAFFEERIEAHQKIADLISPLVNHF